MGRRDATAGEDGQPRLISLDEKHEAHRLLQKALAAGGLDQAEYQRRLGRVYQPVTPRARTDDRSNAGRVSTPHSPTLRLRQALRMRVGHTRPAC